MHTSGQIQEAVAHTRAHMRDMARLLRVDEAKATQDDRRLISRVMATVDADGATFERALQNQDVGQLFARGVLHFTP